MWWTLEMHRVEMCFYHVRSKQQAQPRMGFYTSNPCASNVSKMSILNAVTRPGNAGIKLLDFWVNIHKIILNRVFRHDNDKAYILCGLIVFEQV